MRVRKLGEPHGAESEGKPFRLLPQVRWYGRYKQEQTICSELSIIKLYLSSFVTPIITRVLSLPRPTGHLTFIMAKTAKRRKSGADDVATPAENSICLITRLPFELIAEVLLYSKSPANILSLSRTCKHFHATLVQNPIATFIWKRVRTQTTPPIPEPTKLGLSESQLANFIYGGGKCTVRIPPAFASPRSLVVSGMR